MLFDSERDLARRARSQRARRQPRCGVCGRFAVADELRYGAVCEHCMTADSRAAIRVKVDQVRRFFETRRGA